MRRLENWSIGTKRPYDAPELVQVSVDGNVYGDPSRPDGRPVTTSHLVGAEGRYVHTATGSIYQLGEPSKSYRAWLRVNRPDWDPENPVTDMTLPTGSKQFATTHI